MSDGVNSRNVLRNEWHFDYSTHIMIIVQELRLGITDRYLYIFDSVGRPLGIRNDS